MAPHNPSPHSVMKKAPNLEQALQMKLFHLWLLNTARSFRNLSTLASRPGQSLGCIAWCRSTSYINPLTFYRSPQNLKSENTSAAGWYDSCHAQMTETVRMGTQRRVEEMTDFKTAGYAIWSLACKNWIKKLVRLFLFNKRDFRCEQVPSSHEECCHWRRGRTPMLSLTVKWVWCLYSILIFLSDLDSVITEGFFPVLPLVYLSTCV